MDNPWDEIKKNLQLAREIKRAARQHAEAMAELLDSEALRSLSNYEAARLKKALAKFNIHTGRWAK